MGWDSPVAVGLESDGMEAESRGLVGDWPLEEDAPVLAKPLMLCCTVVEENRLSWMGDILRALHKLCMLLIVVGRVLTGRLDWPGC